MSGQKIIDGMNEALAIAKGEMACAGLFYNGFHYVRREDFRAQANTLSTLTAALQQIADMGPMSVDDQRWRIARDTLDGLKQKGPASA